MFALYFRDMYSFFFFNMFYSYIRFNQKTRIKLEKSSGTNFKKKKLDCN